MRSLKRAFNINDNLYTPLCLVKILDSYIPKHSNSFPIYKRTKILCPFDDKKSEYVKYFIERGFIVEFGDLSTGSDFFKRDKPDVDFIISNPPFSQKLKVFKKLFEWRIPFAMLMNMMAINYQEIGNLFANTCPGVQFIIPDKKVSFNGNTSSFCSGYVTWKINAQTEFVHLENNNSGKFFVPAENYADMHDCLDRR